MNIGVIGVGHIGGTLAEKFVKAGQRGQFEREGSRPWKSARRTRCHQ